MSTRPETTTGSPSRGVGAQAQSMNSKKRNTVVSDNELDNSRHLKKLRKSDDSTGTATRDKKKRRKKRRKMSVTEPTSRSRSKSRSLTVGTQSTVEESNDVTPVSSSVDANPETEEWQQIKDVGDMAPRIPYADKGKGKASEEGPCVDIEPPEVQIARLKKELEAQSLLLQKHQAHLAQVNQSLTCQICLDPLYRPFALAPCGHVFCHPCLVRWFTTPDKPDIHPFEEQIPDHETSHIHKRKKCPFCRTQVTERPVEVWPLKNMVMNLLQSGLTDLPMPAEEVSTADGPSNTAPDPWRNIFRRYNRPFFDFLEGLPPRPPRDGTNGTGGLEEFGMYDAEDGGIYRCIDCMHELMGGVCTHCHREYPGHHGEDDDEEEMDFAVPHPQLRHILDMMAAGQDGLDLGDDDESDSELAFGLGPRDLDDEHDEIDGSEDDGDVPPPRRRLERPNILADFRAQVAAWPWTHNGPPPIAPDGVWPGLDVPGGARIEAVNDEDEDNEDGYESSFIDDEGELSEGPSSSPARPRRITRGTIRVFSDDEGDSEGANLVDGDARGAGRQFRVPQRRNGARAAPIVLDSEDEVQEAWSPQVALIQGRSRPARAPEPVILDLSGDIDHDSSINAGSGDSGDDDDARNYEDDGSRTGPSSRLLRMMQQDYEVSQDDDEDGVEW